MNILFVNACPRKLSRTKQLVCFAQQLFLKQKIRLIADFLLLNGRGDWI